MEQIANIRVEEPEHLTPCFCYHHRDDLKGKRMPIAVATPERHIGGVRHNDHVVGWMLMETGLIGDHREY